MLAAKQYDMVIGLDIHLEFTPLGVPVPFPNIFFGLLMDLGGMAMQAGINLVTTGAATTGMVLVNGMPVAITGEHATAVPNHIVIPPGVAFVINPDNDAKLALGSMTVPTMGGNAVRDMEIALSCSDPVRLPLAMVMALPAGAPVMIGGPPAPNLSQIAQQAIAGAVLSVVGSAIARAFRRFAPQRLRDALAKAVCFLTGHPVDVATGRVVTSSTDWELPGPLPLVFERNYSSSLSWRRTCLGWGWSHSLDQAVWRERGRVVYRSADGREIEFDTIDLRDHIVRVGESVWEPINRLTLRCLDGGAWEIETHEGIVHAFAPVSGGDGRSAMLRRIRNRSGHEIALEYDARGRLEWVRDSGGRLVRFEHDDAGRLVRVALPHPSERGWVTHTRYEYAHDGDLVAVHDPAGSTWHFEYDGHLLVRDTDREGLSFHWGYDGVGASAWCVRTWGDGGIFDHVLDYDRAKGVTTVTNSLDHTTVYRWNTGVVLEVTDPHGATTKYEYDDAVRKVRETDALGGETQWEYDARGNCARVVSADGSEVRVEWEGRNLATRVINEIGAESRWEYDAAGMRVRSIDAGGHRMHAGYESGLLAWVALPGGGVTRFEYDAQKNVAKVTAANGGVTLHTYDNRGREIEMTNAVGGTTRARFNAVGDVIAVQSPTGVVTEYAYDRERNVVGAMDATRHVRLAYGGFYKIVAREEAGTRIRLEYDSEDELAAVVNEADERYSFELDATGLVKREESFDGVVREYSRDKLGRVSAERLSRGRENRMAYDAAGRLGEIAWWDGKTTAFAWRPDGALMRATNSTATVEYERDVLGRVVREFTNGNWVASQYGADGARAVMESSLGARQVAVRDSMGDVTELHHGRGAAGRDFVVGLERDALGLEVGRWMPGRVHQTWERDLAGRPLARRTREDAMEVDARSYQWHGDDQISAIIDAVRGPTMYQRDARGRLVAQRNADGRVLHRAMDAVGNVYRREDRSDRVFGKGGRIERDEAGTVYAHDDDGNLVEKRLADGSAWRYAWDAAGMLREVERPDGKRVAMEYDALARRVRKETRAGERVESGVSFVWDGDFVVHEATDAAGAATWYWQPGTWAPVVKESGGQRWSVASDHLGTPTEMRDEAGRVAWRMQLDAFGVATEEGDAGACPWRWPGQREDGDTGLAYNRFRYYDPVRGDFISTDPVGLRGGIRTRGYVRDSAVLADPLGLSCNPLVQNMQAAGMESWFDGPAAAHHLVAQTASKATRARRILQHVGIGIHDPENGVWLPRQAESLAAAHPGGHTDAYFEAVNARISAAYSAAPAGEEKAAVTHELERIRIDLLMGNLQVSRP